MREVAASAICANSRMPPVGGVHPEHRHEAEAEPLPLARPAAAGPPRRPSARRRGRAGSSSSSGRPRRAGRRAPAPPGMRAGDPAQDLQHPREVVEDVPRVVHPVERQHQRDVAQPGGHVGARLPGGEPVGPLQVRVVRLASPRRASRAAPSRHVGHHEPPLVAASPPPRRPPRPGSRSRPAGSRSAWPAPGRRARRATRSPARRPAPPPAACPAPTPCCRRTGRRRRRGSRRAPRRRAGRRARRRRPRSSRAAGRGSTVVTLLIGWSISAVDVPLDRAPAPPEARHQPARPPAPARRPTRGRAQVSDQRVAVAPRPPSGSGRVRRRSRG